MNREKIEQELCDVALELEFSAVVDFIMAKIAQAKKEMHKDLKEEIFLSGYWNDGINKIFQEIEGN